MRVCVCVLSILQFVCRLSRAVICFIQFGFQILWLFKEANAFLLSKYSGVITLHLNFVLLLFRITELISRSCSLLQTWPRRLQRKVRSRTSALLKFDKNPSKKVWFKHRLIR